MLFRLAVGMLLLSSAIASLAKDRLTFITEEYPPFNYATENGVAGFAVSLLADMMAEAGYEFDPSAVRLLPWARAYETALHVPNTLLFSTTRTTARESLFQWVGPIAPDRVVLLAHRDAPVSLSSIEDITRQGLKVAAIREDIGAQRLLELGIDEEQILYAFSNQSAASMLSAQRVDLWAYGEEVAYWLMEQHGMDPEQVAPVWVLSESALYFAVQKDTDPAIVERLQAALDRVQAKRQTHDHAR